MDLNRCHYSPGSNYCTLPLSLAIRAMNRFDPKVAKYYFFPLTVVTINRTNPKAGKGFEYPIRICVVWLIRLYASTI